MSARDVLNTFGTWALLKLLIALLVFLTLHLTRLPLLWLARLLEFGMTGIDRLITAGISADHTARSRREPLRHNDWR